MRTNPGRRWRQAAASIAAALAPFLLASCTRGASSPSSATGSPGAAPDSSALEQVAIARGLDPAEARAALETFVPPGKKDEFVMFTSGGHAGSIYILGIPSMRLLKEIPVYAPNSWQGWAQGSEEGARILKEGTFSPDLPTQTWGDVHHPQMSLTNGDYDGEWLFCTDKTCGRVAVIDLRDFKTKQIVKTPNVITDHSGVLTENSEYFVTTTFQPSPGGPGGYAPIEEYKEKYRGAMTFHAFDRKAGRIRLEKSFQIELPPYWQDLSASGKDESDSDGMIFCNSINTELAYGGDAEGKPPMEIGASMNEMDFLHVVLWRKAEALVKAKSPKVVERGGIPVIPLEVARDEGLLYFVPESKSPHGCDVVPGGEYIITAGKLDPHVTAYSAKKIRQAIEAKNFERTDPYGVPILKYDAVREAYVEVGLGPLHTCFDDRGMGYTSLFLDSAIARFTLGPPYNPPEKAWKLVEKVEVNYNIGHLQTPASNTRHPRGRYVIALNKWIVDRSPPVGPLHPQNLQLIDTTGEKMRLLSETPIIGEPHNSHILEMEKIAAWRVYPPSTDVATMKAPDPRATKQGEERVERTADGVHAHVVVIRSHYKPDIIRCKQGDHVIIDLTNVESAEDATHGFGLVGYNATASIDPGATQRVEFVASKAGVFPWYCTEFCSALHMEMTGWLLVEPKVNQ
jgi:nitrous-oxide reductase